MIAPRPSSSAVEGGGVATCRHCRAARVLVAAVALAWVLAVPIAGAISNRIRGGMPPKIPNPPGGGDIWTHDGGNRIVMAGATGLFLAVSALRPGKGLVVGTHYMLVSYFAFFVGWGTYFAIGHERNARQRVGSFDWLYGPITDVFGVDGGQRLLWRDLLAMSLRGSMQSVPQGIALLLAGFGPLPMFSGLMMGPLYWLAFQMPSIKTDPPKGYFDRGTELGEAAFGYWLWVCIALAMLVFHVRGQCSLAPADERDAEIVAAPVSWLSGPACVLLHLFLLTHEVLFALSLASYSHVHQKDHRNHAQTMLGLGVSLGATAAGHLVLVRAQCLAAAVAVPPEEAVATARRGGPASLEASPSLPGPLLRPLTAGQAGAAPRSGASDASGLGARTLWERYVASSRSRRAKAEGRVLAPAEARRPPVEYGASQSVNAYEAAASSGTLLGIEASPQPADLTAHLSDVHSGHAIRAAMGEDPRWQDEDGEASLSARRAARSAPRSSSSSCCCHRDTVGEWGCFGGMDASAAIATGHLAPLLLEAATAPRGATAASSAEIHGPSRAMEGQDCIRLWLCSRPTARNLATPHGAAHLLLVAVCVAWYVVWFFGTLVLVGLDTHPWGSWAGASG
ncbi:hypothetical protein FNF29_07403 [Cafeteria roenbergensis]|uniref:Uncharacterized protein n=1 Tax=Cafeteria roenbergensis TaxID=33653 RepID=A0A5A8C3G1_CAFRO|nr:hypothetical protein FNF29_07403 [Cafeteria roenbergensis]|eukprot:KAA0147335.1 hypothetical protein FNF29_07403 [Cafeteria roenbergensis]